MSIAIALAAAAAATTAAAVPWTEKFNNLHHIHFGQQTVINSAVWLYLPISHTLAHSRDRFSSSLQSVRNPINSRTYRAVHAQIILYPVPN